LIVEQFVALPFYRLAQAHSIREIYGGPASCFGKADHWVSRGLLSDRPCPTPTNTGLGSYIAGRFINFQVMLACHVRILSRRINTTSVFPKMIAVWPLLYPPKLINQLQPLPT
jgi:hypothetical protein